MIFQLFGKSSSFQYLQKKKVPAWKYPLTFATVVPGGKQKQSPQKFHKL